MGADWDEMAECAERVLDHDALAREHLSDTEYQQLIVRKAVVLYCGVTDDDDFLRDSEILSEDAIRAIRFAESTCATEDIPGIPFPVIDPSTIDVAAVDAWIRENVGRSASKKR